LGSGGGPTGFPRNASYGTSRPTQRLPGPLDLVHVTSVGAGREIVSLGQIDARPCIVFESAILVVEGVAAARVYGKPDPSYGKIVAADIVVNAEFEAADVLKRVRNTLEPSLAKY
jgi:hypothetical protein